MTRLPKSALFMRKLYSAAPSVACIAIALLLAACVSVRTELGDDIGSGCIRANAAYHGYRYACASLACPAADRSKAASLYASARRFCEPGVLDSPANRSTLAGLVTQLRAVGRAK